MPRDKIRIYLSSTFEDLKAHRAAVYTALTKAGYEVQSMEHYTASDQRHDRSAANSWNARCARTSRR